MAWKIEHQRFENILRVTAEGSISTEDVLSQVSEGIALIRREGISGALIDYSLAALEMQVSEILKMPDLFEALELPRRTRMAIALPSDPANMHKYTLFDDVATARGYLVKLFWEPSRAMHWVLAK